MILAIVGTRTFDDYILFKEIILEKTNNLKNISAIITGDATGVDSFAVQLAKSLKIKYFVFRANWNKYGKAAGPIRNEYIVKNCDIAIVIWNGKSRGTRSAIDFLKKYKKEYMIIKY